MLVGAVLGSTNAAVVLPAIEISAPEPIKITLTLESSLGEIIAVLTVGTLISLGSDQSLVEGSDQWVRPSHSDRRCDRCCRWSYLVAPLAACSRTAFQQRAESGNSAWRLCRWTLFGGTGLVAKLVFGLTLANMPRTPRMVWRRWSPRPTPSRSSQFWSPGSGALAGRVALVDTRCQCG